MNVIPRLKQETYTVDGVESPVSCVHIKFEPNGDILFAPSWSKLVVANYWSVLRFNDLFRWLTWYPYPIIYHNKSPYLQNSELKT